MRYTVEKLSKLLGVKPKTIDLYRCNPRFSHIKKERLKDTTYYLFVTAEDVRELEKWLRARKRRRSK